MKASVNSWSKLQEKYDKMDWLSYGAQERREGERNGDRKRLEQDARRMYAEGIMPDVISRIVKEPIDTVREILGLQPA